MDTEQKNVTYDSKNKIIILSALEELSLETMSKSINQIMELSAIHNCESVLIDLTNTKSFPPTFDMYSFGEELVHTLGIQKLRFAFALSDDIFDTFKLFDDVFANRGLYFHIFKDLDKARDWLLK
jgi:hypothetical protein